MSGLQVMKERLVEVKEKVQEHLSFKELVELWKGSQDIEKRANVILNPRTPETSTNLTTGQVDFVTICLTIAQYYPEFRSLEVFAREFLLTSTSQEGWGVDRMIQHEQAISEKRLVQLGLKPTQEQEKDVK